METQTEHKASSQQTKFNEVLEKINEIAKESADDNYIYRGESQAHEKVSSSLYRELPHTEGVHFDMESFQDVILTEAKTYVGKTDDIDETDNIGILTELQHFGGKTNLIDFTEDYLIALFFACDGSHEKDGQVILLKRESDDYEIRTPRRTIHRVESQKSVFVESRTGFIEPDIVVTIPANLKFPMLNYLEKYHRISIATIYNDLHGFIRRSAYIEFLKALTCQRNADEAKTREEKDEHNKTAVRHYTEAIKLKPDFVNAYNNRGLAYAEKSDFGAAIEDYSKAIDLDPELTEVYNNRGVAYHHTGDFGAAISDFNKSIDLDPEDARFYNNRGLAYAEKSDFGAAIEDYSKAIDLDPELTEVYNNRGVAYHHTGDFGAAISDFNKSIDLDPEDAGAYFNRGVAYCDMGDFSSAILDFNKSIDLDPEDARFYSNRGGAYAGLSDFGAAISDFNKSIDLAPKEALVYANRGLVYLHTGDFSSAISDYNKAIDLDPENADTYINRSIAYLCTGDFGAAIEDCNKAMDLDPENARAYCNRGEAWFHLKEWQKAKADLITAQKMGVDIIAPFQNAYESVEDFETKHRVKLPKDIAALLQRK